MLDRHTRVVAIRSLTPTARWLERQGVSPNALTLFGFGFGVAACIAAGLGHWQYALFYWLVNRLFDGLDGMVARHTCPTNLGGFWDILADFAIYSGFVAAVAIALPETRLAAVVLLSTYYISGASFLTWSSLMERQAISSTRNGAQQENGDDSERSVKFLPGLAEGTETIVAYTLICLFPTYAAEIMWLFAALVAITAVQRIWWASQTLE